MTYTIALNNVNDSDMNKVGYRALDFAKIFQAKYSMPISFIIPNSMREEFLLENKLGINIRNILNGLDYESDVELKNAYHKIKQLFESAEFNEELTSQLKEAYDSLDVGIEKHSAEDLLKESEPVINLVPSPNYKTGTEDMNGVLMNLHGFNNFLLGLKSCWLSVYISELLVIRKKKDITEFNLGVIVQRFLKAEATAETYSKGSLGDYELIVRAYLGLPDILRKCSKDVFSVSKEYLRIESSKKARQEYKITWGDEKNKLVKLELGVKGSEQKLTDKEIMEVARITKRIAVLMNFNLKGYFLVRRGIPYIFFISRFPDEAVSERSEEILVEDVSRDNVEPVSEQVDEVSAEEVSESQEVTEENPKVEYDEDPESEEFVDDEDFILPDKGI